MLVDYQENSYQRGRNFRKWVDSRNYCEKNILRFIFRWFFFTGNELFANQHFKISRRIDFCELVQNPQKSLVSFRESFFPFNTTIVLRWCISNPSWHVDERFFSTKIINIQLALLSRFSRGIEFSSNMGAYYRIVGSLLNPIITS